MKNELAFKDHTVGFKVAKALLDEEYVVMLSYEEELLVINYEFAPNSDRNYVVFMARDEYEEEADKIYDDIINDLREEGMLK